RWPHLCDGRIHSQDRLKDQLIAARRATLRGCSGCGHGHLYAHRALQFRARTATRLAQRCAHQGGRCNRGREHNRARNALQRMGTAQLGAYLGTSRNMLTFRFPAEASSPACNPAGRSATMGEEETMAESVYKIIELVGTSTDSWEKAAAGAVERAAKTL